MRALAPRGLISSPPLVLSRASASEPDSKDASRFEERSPSFDSASLALGALRTSGKARGKLLVLVVPLLLLAIAAPAHAGIEAELADAEARKANLDWEGALVAADRALAAGDGTPATMAFAYRLAGELSAGLGRIDVAIAYFERGLAIEPSGRLRDGASPKIVEPFERARTRIEAIGPLAVRADGGVGRVGVAIENDPLGLVAGARATWPGDQVVARGAAPYTLVIPAGVARVDVDVIDMHGNAIWSGPVDVAQPSASATSRRPMWKPWAAASVVSLVAGGVFAWRRGVAQDEWDRLNTEPGEHDYSELVAVEDRGRRHARFANVAFGVAAAAGVVAIVQLVRGRDAVTLDVRPDAVGVAFRGRF